MWWYFGKCHSQTHVTDYFHEHLLQNCSCEFHSTQLIMSQHCFSYWLATIRPQTITWANVHLDLCRHIASLDQNALLTNHTHLICGRCVLLESVHAFTIWYICTYLRNFMIYKHSQHPYDNAKSLITMLWVIMTAHNNYTLYTFYILCWLRMFILINHIYKCYQHIGLDFATNTISHLSNPLHVLSLYSNSSSFIIFPCGHDWEFTCWISELF